MIKRNKYIAATILMVKIYAYKSQAFWMRNDGCGSKFVYAHDKEAQMLVHFSSSCPKYQVCFDRYQFHERGGCLVQGAHGNNLSRAKGIWGCSLPLVYRELHESLLLLLPETGS